MSEEFPIVFDCTLRRPACPLLQSAMGGDTSLCGLFPAGSWLINPTPDMKVYRASREQIDKLIAMVEA